MNIGDKILVYGEISPEYIDNKRVLVKESFKNPIKAHYLGTTYRYEGNLKKEYDYEEGSLYRSFSWTEFKQTKRIQVIQWREKESSKIRESFFEQIKEIN